MFGRFIKSQNLSIDKLVAVLIAGLIFFTPTNWFIKLYENQAYIHGLFSDYLLVRIYPTDLIVLILLIVLVVKLSSKINLIKFGRQNWITITAYGVLSLILILKPLVTNYPVIGSLSAGRLLILSGFVILLRQWWMNLSALSLSWTKMWIGLTALATVLFQSSLGLYQFFWQKSLFGYRFFGEAQLANPIGIAHVTWRGHELVLPYATTAHPNVLAGSIVILLIIGWSLLANNQSRIIKSLLWSTTLLGVLCLMTTTSVSGILAWLLAVSGFIYLKQVENKKIKPINSHLALIGWIVVIAVMPIILSLLTKTYHSNTSILRRNELNQSAVYMIFDQPLLGTGAGLFTTNLDQYLPKFEPVVFLQPVHHVPLLFVAQTGILGLCWLWCWWQLLKKSDQYFSHNPANILPIPKLIFSLMILPLLALDHYLLSLQTGQILSVLILFLVSWNNHSSWRRS